MLIAITIDGNDTVYRVYPDRVACITVIFGNILFFPEGIMDMPSPENTVDSLSRGAACMTVEEIHKAIREGRDGINIEYFSPWEDRTPDGDLIIHEEELKTFSI